MKTFAKIFASVIVLGIAGFTVNLFLNRPEATAEQKVVVAPAPPRTIDAFGVIKALEIQNIVIDFPAYIRQVHVREGQRVTSGDILFQLDITEYTEAIRSRSIELQTRQKEYAVRKEYQAAQNDPDIKRLENELKNAQFLYEEDLKELEKREKLYESGVISRYTCDEYHRTVESRRKAVEDAKLNLKSLRFIKSTDADRSSEAVSTMFSDLHVLRNRLNRPFIKGNTVVSTIENGIVYDLQYFAGDRTVQSSEQLQKLCSILDVSSIVVVADVDEEFIGEITLGANVKITLLADPTKEYRGKIKRIANRAIVKNNETYIPVEIAILNMDELVRPEMNVDVQIERAQPKSIEG